MEPAADGVELEGINRRKGEVCRGGMNKIYGREYPSFHFAAFRFSLKKKHF